MSTASLMAANEQKQQLSVAYVHAVAARAGYACQVQHVDDDSIDVQVAARGWIHEQSVCVSPRLDLQLKATALPPLAGDHLPFPLPVKNYNDLRGLTLVPRVLVVLHLPLDSSNWIEQSESEMQSRHCAYWLSLFQQPETQNSSTVTVHLPRQQMLTVDALRGLMEGVSRGQRP
jgi:hypothetical protein